MAFQLDITDNATTQDTVDTIIKVINKTAKEGFAPELAKALNPEGDKEAYIKRLFEFICDKVNYLEDPKGWEKVVTPAKLFLDAVGDCKKMTTAIAATLKAAGIEPLLKVVSYDGNNWKHIYVIAKVNNKYYTLDPVNKKTFDSEVKHKLAAVYNLAGNFEIMPGTKLSVLGSAPGFDQGLNELCNDMDMVGTHVGAMLGMEPNPNTTGIDLDDLETHFNSKNEGISGMSGLFDKLKNAINKVATVVKKDVSAAETTIKKDANIVISVAKKLGAAPLRGAFLGILLLGKALEDTPIKIHLAAKLAEAWKKDNGKKISDIWTSFGGDPKELKSVISKGASVTLAGIDNQGNYNIEGLGVVTIAAIGAAIAAATPILAVIHKLLNDTGIVKPGSPDDKNISSTISAGASALNADGSIPAGILNKLPKAAGAGVTDISFNTFIKALFLISISPVVPGVFFYVLNFLCLSTISIFLITKSKSYEVQF